MDIKNFKQFLFESDEEDKFLKDLASMLIDNYSKITDGQKIIDDFNSLTDINVFDSDRAYEREIKLTENMYKRILQMAKSPLLGTMNISGIMDNYINDHLLKGDLNSFVKIIEYKTSSSWDSTPFVMESNFSFKFYVMGDRGGNHLMFFTKEELETFLHPFRGKIHGTKYGI